MPSRPLDLDPAEHDVARRLGQALALDHALAAVRELALPEERLEHRRLGLLELEEQRIVVVLAEQKADPGARADTPDADHLPGRVNVPVALEQLPPVAGERPPVGADHAVQELVQAIRLIAGDVLDRHDQRRITGDPRFAVDDRRQLAERLHAVLRASLGDVRFRSLHDRLDLLRRLTTDLRHQVVNVDPRVPETEIPHRREPRDVLPVRAPDLQVDRLPLLRVEATVAAGDGEACDKPLHVPFERALKGLVEVVEAEDHLAIGRSVATEVREVGIAAELGVK